jgi:ketosteroid isomerase-like protein
MLSDGLQLLLDRTQVSDTLCRYGSSVDSADWAALRQILTDDARVRYGNADWIDGADNLVKLLENSMADSVWSHHLIVVYHVDFDGDEARALSYQTSHLMVSSTPDVARATIGRYHDRLRRTTDGWKISRKVMEILWSGERRDTTRQLEAMGGRGPSVEEFEI